jgi:hypothetical protein
MAAARMIVLLAARVEQSQHPMNLRFEDLEPVPAGVAEAFDREQPHVSKHHIQRGSQVMSNSGEIHDAICLVGHGSPYVCAGLRSHWKN